MTAKKGLQKLTIKMDKIEWLFSLEKVTFKELGTLTSAERERALQIMNEKIRILKGEELDEFVERFNDIWAMSTKNVFWENNHILITRAISKLIQENRRMPTKTEIAFASDLSRQTVHNHLKEYSNHSQYLDFKIQFSFMKSKVLAKVLQYALDGDMRAAKIFLNTVSSENKFETMQSTHIHNQNNFIQINGKVLSQETIMQLNDKQLGEIENILKSVLDNEKIEIK